MQAIFRARHILVNHEFEAKDILKKLTEGKSFESLARDYSQCSSGKNGGDLGTFPKGRMIPAFEKALLGLKLNQVSGIVRTKFGYHIIERLPVNESEAPSA